MAETESAPGVRVAVVIPWREQPSRLFAFNEVRRWYEELMPDADIILADNGEEEFHRSGSRNHGVRLASDYDVVILNDADTIPEIVPLEEAIEDCQTTGLVHLPYREYRSLGVEGTQAFLRDVPLSHCPHTIVYTACSGVYVTTPETWWMHGGQDEEFRGWGFEDPAWLFAHTTLLGSPPVRHEGRVYALHHDAATKEGDQYTRNAHRCALYENASGDYDAMHALVFGE